jgi:hypothetical protein
MNIPPLSIAHQWLAGRMERLCRQLLSGNPITGADLEWLTELHGPYAEAARPVLLHAITAEAASRRRPRAKAPRIPVDRGNATHSPRTHQKEQGPRF